MSLCLSQSQAKLCILDDDERIALADVLVVIEAYLLDKSTHTGIDGCNVPPHLSVVSIFHVAPMYESAANQSNNYHKGCNNHYVIRSLYLFLVHNFLPFYCFTFF